MLGEKINFGDLVAWEKARSELKKEQEYISDEHIQKDALGNEYLEFEIEDPITKIEAKAIDHSDNTTTLYKTLKILEEESFSWIPWILMGMVGLVGAVAVIILRKHGANQDLEK